jgi:hypothetical protein
MPFGRSRARIVARRGRFVLNLPDGERDLVRQLLGELRALLALGPEHAHLRRLYPAAHTDDPELEAEYRQLTQGDLAEGRTAAIETVAATIDAEELSADELTAWMHAVNSLRLVIGTMLDVAEEDPFAIDPDDPDARHYMLYGYLGLLLEEIVQAQLGD